MSFPLVGRLGPRSVQLEDVVDETGGSCGLRAFLRSALGVTAARLAKHSAAAQSLVTAEEDAVDAAIACCAMLLREHAIEFGVAIESIDILAELADGVPITWQKLSELRDQPLTPALRRCNKSHTQQLHTISDLLQFPKQVTLVLEQQLAVFRIRDVGVSGATDTATLVRTEPSLVPLLSPIHRIVDCSQCFWFPSRVSVLGVPAFWRGFYGDAEDVESLDGGRRELDHIAFGAGRLLGGRGLLPDLLTMLPRFRQVPQSGVLSCMAAVAGDAAAIAALHHAGVHTELSRCTTLAIENGQLNVLRFAVTLGRKFDICDPMLAAMALEVASDLRLEIISLLRDHDPQGCSLVALSFLSDCSDVLCARWLLKRGIFEKHVLAEAVVSAALAGSVPLLDVLWSSGAPLTAEAFRVSRDPATLQWFVDRGFRVDHGFVWAAVHGGRLVQLDWAASVTDIAPFLSCELFARAAAAPFRESTACMEWLRARGCPWDAEVVASAHLRRSHLCLAYALRHGCPVPDAVLRAYLANMHLRELKPAVQALRDTGRGHLVVGAELFVGARRHLTEDTAEWVVCDLGFDPSSSACSTGWGGQPLGHRAAANGCLRLLQHLCQKGLYTPGPVDMRAALHQRHHPSGRGHLSELARWLHSQGVATHGPVLAFEIGFDCQPHHPTADAPEFLTFQAARVGELQPLRVLVEECGAVLAESACVAAAEGGHMDVLRWALGKSCPCAAAAWRAAVACGGAAGDFRPLDLFHRSKRPWDESVWAAAARFGEVQAWLLKRGCPGSHPAEPTPSVAAIEPARAGAGSGADAAGP